MSRTEKTIPVTCSTRDSLPLDKIVAFQGELKTLSKEDFAKLRASIVKHGLSFPSFVWKQNGKMRCLDGHQRSRVLAEMRNEGYKIPDIPVVYVDAKNEREAREKILLLTSQYGHYTMDSVYEFIEEGGLNFGDLKEIIEFPKFDMDKFGFAFYDDKPPADSNGEQMADAKYVVVVSCNDEQHQASLLEYLTNQGLQCRALIS